MCEGRLRALVDLIYELPAASRTVEAQMLDPELATALLERETKKEKEKETKNSLARLREDTAEVRMLRTLCNILIQANSDPKKKPKFLEPPETALATAKKTLQRKAVIELIKATTPWAIDPDTGELR